MQGRFKRDGGAAGDPEQRGGAEHGPARRDETADAGTAGAQSDVTPGIGVRTGPKHGSRIAMRNWRISTRLVSLLALPVVAATTLGALRIQSSLENVQQLEAMTSLTDLTEQATKLAAALQEERDASAGPLSSTPRDLDDDNIKASQAKTKLARTAYIAAANEVSPDLTGVNASLSVIGRNLQELNSIRERAYEDHGYISQTVSDYNDIIQSLIDLSQELAEATGNSDMIASTRALAAFSAAKEYDSIQRAVVSAALADDRKLSSADFRYLSGVHRSENTELKQFSQIYGRANAADLLKGLNGGNDIVTKVDDQVERITASESSIQNFKGTSYLDWDDDAKTKLQVMGQIEQTLLQQMQQKALTLRDEAQQEAILSGALILLVLGISVVGAFVVARSMVRSLRRLQDTAQEVAQKRLPELVKQLSESDPQDVDTSVESIGIHTRDEIGQVARAFDEVHREAVRLAAEQALLRGNVNAMFTNLSRRSQGLIQRQLSLISELESREADPDQLSSLFKLDHLATRMRRNGENLLVLAGEEPGRRWTRPVPLVDVLRAAASEVEQYERIELTSVPAVEVTGRVVNDLVHLLAELLENATSFSSPQTKVRVTGHALPDGRVLIEIHDTGIGLSPEDLADINERLANPPTVDVSVSRRMGLFVVGRLSLRHGIRIQLRPSDSGGTTALVMLPVDVTQGGAKPQPGAGSRGQQPGGAPAGAPGAPAPAMGGGGTGLAGMHRGGHRGQVSGSASRPALNSGPGLGPQGGRPAGPGAPTGPGPQRSGPSWANEQVPGGQGRPQQPQQAQHQQQAQQRPAAPRSVRRPRSRWARPTDPRPTCRAVTRTWSPRRSSSARTSTRCRTRRRRTAARRPRTCRRPRRCRKLRRPRRCRSTAARSRSSRASSPAATSSSAPRRRRLLSTRRHLSTRRRRRPRRPLRRPRRAHGTPRATPRAPVAGTSSVPRPRRPTGSRCRPSTSRWRCPRPRAARTSPARSSTPSSRTGSAPVVRSACSRCTSRVARSRRSRTDTARAPAHPPCRRSARSSPLRSSTSSTSSSRSGPAPSTRHRPRTRHSPRSRRSPRGAIRRRGGPRRTTRCGSAPARCASRPPAGSPRPVCRGGSPRPTSSREPVLPSKPHRAVRRSRGRPTTCADA
ncbi:nitrate- and nitrite sensing domain-containing protein [Actinacidiphila glaucinigra]|uniref:sensor histidine kinase n=1 Tax=Actinacidiphila glaucinigra TaxID=235986 RepID=UPI003D91DFAC